jgi:hypothetical protein
MLAVVRGKFPAVNFLIFNYNGCKAIAQGDLGLDQTFRPAAHKVPVEKPGHRAGNFPMARNPGAVKSAPPGDFRESVNQLRRVEAGWSGGRYGGTNILIGVADDILVKIPLDILAALIVAGNVKGDKS